MKDDYRCISDLRLRSLKDRFGIHTDGLTVPKVN